MPQLNSKSITAEELTELGVVLPDFSALQKSMILPQVELFESFQKMINSQIGPLLEAIDRAMIVQTKLFNNFRLPNITSVYWPSHNIDVEKAVPVLPAASHQDVAVVRRARLGLKALPGGSFSYKRRILKGIAATKSLHGKFLLLLIGQPTFFASDEAIRKELRVGDNRDLSYIIRDLKAKFRKNNLVLVAERRWGPDGYQLIGVEILH